MSPNHIKLMEIARYAHLDVPELDYEVVRAEGRLEVMIPTSAAYLLGSCGNVNTKDITLCDTTGEDLATLSI